MKKLFSILLGLSFVAIGATAYAVGNRQATGEGATISFESGATVSGNVIELDKGGVFKNCVLRDAQSSGRVTNGVIWPWEAEISSGKPCAAEEPADSRKATGVNNTLRFDQNIPVMGNIIKLDTGKTYTNCYFPMAPSAGEVTTGVIHPWAGETSGATTCYSQDYNNQNRNQPTVTPTPTSTPTTTPNTCPRGRCGATPTPTPLPSCGSQEILATIANLTHSEANYWHHYETTHYPIPFEYFYYNPNGPADLFAPLSGGRLYDNYTYLQGSPAGLPPGTIVHTDKALFNLDQACY